MLIRIVMSPFMYNFFVYHLIDDNSRCKEILIEKNFIHALSELRIKGRIPVLDR